MQIDLYIGPFSTEQLAFAALPKITSVLYRIQQKSNKEQSDMGGGGWELSTNETITNTSGNNFEYGFFFIKGYRILPK